MSGNLPWHPDEVRLRTAELELAETIEELAGKVTAALRSRDRATAVTLLTQLGATAELARRAEAKAINDQMREAMKGKRR